MLCSFILESISVLCAHGLLYCIHSDCGIVNNAQIIGIKGDRFAFRYFVVRIMYIDILEYLAYVLI